MIASYVGRWLQAQQEQLLLCEKIDRMAERLPLRDVGAFDLVAGQLTQLLERVHAFEEDDLFPVLEAVSPQMRPLLVTFRSHHAMDLAQVQGIAELFAQRTTMTADCLRDLKLHLELFSETLRRHVQFEDAIATALFASGRFDERSAIQ